MEYHRESIKKPKLVNPEVIREYRKTLIQPEVNKKSRINVIFIMLLVLFLVFFLFGSKYGFLSESYEIVGHYS